MSQPASSSSSSSSPPTDNEARVIVQSWNIQYGDGNPDSVVECTMTPSEYAAHQEQKASRKARMMATLQKRVDDHGGKDREDAVRNFSNPGAEELLASLDSVIAEWRNVAADTLRAYFVTGKPPTDLATDTLARYNRRARTCVAETMEDASMQAILVSLPTAIRDDFVNHHIAKGAPALVPVLWLEDKMLGLCVRPELARRTIFTCERKAALADVEKQWIDVVMLHNGFCKTVLELQQHHS